MATEFWKSLSKAARWGFITGVVLILMLTLTLGFVFLRTDYQVLFSNLKPQDANAMVTELDRLKVPYKLANEGTTILVDRDAVHKTRLKLMGKDFPLQGTVGFELFNNSDFGMTEFTQKINYQRAMQGEITRTILSFSEVESARVHLALPEEGLFKKSQNRAKAAISLVLKSGHQLANEQVTGIQRLVSAAVPAIQTQDVTIVDQRGVALTKVAQDENNPDATSPRLELKRETENYLTKKAQTVLGKIFGDTQSIVSVDVTLNMDRIKITTDDVIGIPSKAKENQTGVVVREKENLRDTLAPLDARGADTGVRGQGSANRETEYQVGHRVEQVVSAPGAISKLHVVAVVSKDMDIQQLEQIRQLVFAAVGASQERGDSVVIQSQKLIGSVPEVPVNEIMASVQPQDNHGTQTALNSLLLPLILLMGATLLIGLFLGKLFFGRKPQQSMLTEEERIAAMQQIQTWLKSPTTLNQAKGKE